MANSRSAEKRYRQDEVRRARNRAARSRLRTAIKKLRTAADQNEGATAEELLGRTLRLIDATASKKVIHRNTAARQKSRLVALVRRLSA